MRSRRLGQRKAGCASSCSDLTVNQDLNKKSEDPEVKEDLAKGIEAAERVLSQANAAVDRDLLDEALEDLVVRVDDWKNHRVESFGKLLQHGMYSVITGRTDQEKFVRTPRCIRLLVTWGLLTFRSSSTRSTSLSASYCAARRYNLTSRRRRRTRPSRPFPKRATRTTNCSSRGAYL